MPAVSVIVPTYNHARYLPEAINSILGQTFRDFEIIVVDDGSTDNTPQVVEGYGDVVRYVYQENRGLSAARNTGLAHARGKYIALLDADDLFEPEFLRLMVGALEANPNAGAAYCGLSFIDEVNHVMPKKYFRSVLPETMHGTLLKGNIIGAPNCIVICRDCYDKAGLFDISLTSCEDWDMWIRISQTCAMIPVNAFLAQYRLLTGSMSSNPQRMLDNRLAVLKKHHGLDSSESLYTLRCAVANAYWLAMLEWIQAGNDTQALNCLLLATQNNPQLLSKLETYFEFVAWDQPKGWRGDFGRLDLVVNERKVVDFLDRYFSNPDLPDDLRSFRKYSLSLTYEVLGLISYGLRNTAIARQYLSMSVRIEPKQITNKRVISTFIKSFLVRKHHPRKRPDHRHLTESF